MNKTLLYDLDDKMPLKHVGIYGFQELLSILVATLLIANICSVSVGAGLIGAGLSTIIYILITRWKSNVYISNSGTYVAPVLFAFATGGATSALVGAITICIIYCLFGIIFQHFSIDTLYKFLPIPLIASVTILIGLSLIGFVPTYLGDTGIWGTIIALIVAVSIVVTMHYGKGKMKTLPFLVGVGIGYVLCIILTITGIAPLVDFSVFNNVQLLQIPDFNFLHLTPISTTTIVSIIIIYAAYSLTGACEIIADHQAMSVVIGRDLFKLNGIRRIFVAMGIANAASGFISGLGQTSYGEGTGCTAASKVANAKVTFTTSLFLIFMGFCGPIQALMVSIPSIVFAGASLVLYPLIAIAGFKMLINNQVNLDNSKNLALVAVPISVGLGGIVIGGSTISFSGTALALIIGIILNLILKDKKEVQKETQKETETT